MPSYTAVKAFSYAGRPYAAGDTVELPPRDGRLFVALKRVQVAESKPSRKPTPAKAAPTAAKPPPAKAEPADKADKAEPAAAKEKPDLARYKTRQMKAKE